MAATSQETGEDYSEPEGMSLTKLLRPLSERRESVRPFVPWVGGPRMYLLLLYAAVVIGAGIEFFLSWETWYGNWEIYNSYLFVVSGAFLLVGVYLLFDLTSVISGKAGRIRIPLPRTVMGQTGIVVTVASIAALAMISPSDGGSAVLLSVLAVLGFMMVVMASKVVDESDVIFVTLFGVGLILAMLVPVHEAYDVARTDDGVYLFSGLNLSLLVIGAVLSIIALELMRTRDGHFAAWLIGSMAIFLVAFHEQVGILPSGALGQYDRGLAAVGIVFSFVPLVMYMWREVQYDAIWSRLRKANSLIMKGDFNSAADMSERALQISFDAGIARRFALPWALKGDSLYGLKEHMKAKMYYDMAIEIDPADDMSWCQVGNINAFDAKRAVALNSYERALKINPKNPYAWNNKGVIYVSLAWPEEAMVCFNKAMLLMPKNFDAHINLAKLTSKLGRHDEAVMHYQHAQELRPESEVAAAGLRREFVRGQRIDQIRGWEQLGLDTRYLWRLLKEDPADFEKRTKEFLSSIVEQRTQLTVGLGGEKFNVNDAIKTILKVTEESGATMHQIEEKSGLTRDQIVLPMALLMKTDRLHFTRFGEKDIYVSKGKAPDKPSPPPVKEALVEPETGHEEGEVEDTSEDEGEEEPQQEQEPKRVRGRLHRGRRDEDIEPTASVLVFGRSRPKEKEKPKKRSKGRKKSA
ncbi:MAG: tetratricopeptide repeat protein [Methanobacteriota archaeon]|nr:MAG: tetratricopeptide repeat protein [Euryarchaeota archaeon]